MDAFSFCSSLKDVYIAQLDVIALFPPTNILEYGANIWLNGELLTEYTFPDGTVKIDNRLRGCKSIETVVIPNDVVSIDSYAFAHCSNLRSIAISNSVISIGLGVFENCSSLASITIPDSVTSIGVYAFAYCTSLAEVYCKPTTPPTVLSWDAFDRNADNRKIYVPSESVEAYKTADGWSYYADAIEGYDFE